MLGFAARLAGCWRPGSARTSSRPSMPASSGCTCGRRPASRIEETERIFGQVEDVIREIVPDNERDMILDNMGLTPSFTTRAYVDNGTVSDGDGEILVSLKPEHGPTADYVARLREELPKRFPDCTFYFQPADITSQILDFGLPAPINVQVVGVNREENLAVAKKLRREMAKIPGIADVHIHQITDYPTLRVDVDRVMASELGLTQQSVTGSVLVSLSGTTQVTPNYWVNPQNRVNYVLAVQTPPDRDPDRGRPDEHADHQRHRCRGQSPAPATYLAPSSPGRRVPARPDSRSRAAVAAAAPAAEQHLAPAPHASRRRS